MQRLLLAFILLWSSGLSAADFVLNSGRKGSYSLEINGEIRPGDTDRLALIFSGKKRFPLTTRLDITGGDLHESVRLGGLLRQAHLSVMSEENCDLACFVVLVGGVSRTISTDLTLSPLDDPVDNLEAYLAEMGVPAELTTEILGSIGPVSIPLRRFDKEIGESPAVLEEKFVARCGQLSAEETADFRSLQAYRFVESLKSLEARSGRSEELSPIIAKYEVLAEDAADLGPVYSQQLLTLWQGISECRKQVLSDAQDQAIEQVVAQAQGL